MRRTDEHTESAAPASSRGSAANNRLSLEDVHGSVDVPHHQAGFWEQWRAFVGPAVLVSVGYMDPGNWGTDLQGGAQFKYGLLWVVGLASLMAIFMQVISARLGALPSTSARSQAPMATSLISQLGQRVHVGYHSRQHWARSFPVTFDCQRNTFIWVDATEKN